MTDRSAGSDGCGSRRIAQGEIAVVEQCDCGILRVHPGALTLRLTPHAVSSLVGTLREALDAAESWDADQALGTALLARKRGRA